MSTRATITFRDNFDISHVYKHSDGYPKHTTGWGIIPMLAYFFKLNKKYRGKVTSLDDASRLAAQFTAFLFTFAEYGPLGAKASLNAIPKWLTDGIRVLSEATGDTAYHYVIECEDRGRIPTVRVYTEPLTNQELIDGTYKQKSSHLTYKNILTQKIPLKEKWDEFLRDATVPSFEIHMDELREKLK